MPTILKTTVTLKSTGECGCFNINQPYQLIAQDVEGYGRGSAYSLQEGIFTGAKYRDVILQLCIIGG